MENHFQHFQQTSNRLKVIDYFIGELLVNSSVNKSTLQSSLSPEDHHENHCQNPGENKRQDYLFLTSLSLKLCNKIRVRIMMSNQKLSNLHCSGSPVSADQFRLAQRRWCFPRKPRWSQSSDLVRTRVRQASCKSH